MGGLEGSLRLKDKAALVTGTFAGLGTGIWRAFAEKGASVWHSVGKHDWGQTQTNGVESFRTMLKA